MELEKPLDFFKYIIEGYESRLKKLPCEESKFEGLSRMRINIDKKKLKIAFNSLFKLSLRGSKEGYSEVVR